MEKWEYGELHFVRLTSYEPRPNSPSRQTELIAVYLGGNRVTWSQWDRSLVDVQNELGAEGWQVSAVPAKSDAHQWIKEKADEQPVLKDEKWTASLDVVYPMRRRTIVADPA
ncbi:hypothetical protein [Plantactinospora endophytica]|uniref:DUF4177 domain-containing protein n=1 Tax=Plantactinospora endophytica TaxID=673535 RepID=A0ABQ4EES5_9ACTN|nr:hypothetical protein [Plantactinospora endophytica]GIG93155.1 hypothetical protein Pen02_80910 [Plantactinospora endophytica]